MVMVVLPVMPTMQSFVKPCAKVIAPAMGPPILGFTKSVISRLEQIAKHIPHSKQDNTRQKEYGKQLHKALIINLGCNSRIQIEVQIALPQDTFEEGLRGSLIHVSCYFALKNLPVAVE
jgi:hypothetical protein